MRSIRKWLQRLAVLVAGLAVLLTLSSFGYNALTGSPVAAPTGLKYVKTGSFLTRYKTWGTAGSPVVLVHGFIESADTWDPVAELLAPNHRVYAYDELGFGYTQRISQIDLAAETKQLLDFLAEMGLTRPLLVGHSAGAAVIAEAALQDPTAVGGLVFLDGDALSLGAGPPAAVTTLMINPFRTTFLRLGIRSDYLIRAVYSSQCGPRCAPLDEAGIQQWRRPLQVPGALEGLWSLSRHGGLGLPMSEVAKLSLLPVPKGVIFGAADVVFGTSAAAQTATRIGAPAPIIIAGARHLTLISHAQVVAAAISAVAAKIRAS
ncbi:MAG: alpha/beta hydrolase [Actinomycetes bacterium]